MAAVKVNWTRKIYGGGRGNEGIRATADQFNEPFNSHDQTQLRTGVFLYEDGDIRCPAAATRATPASCPWATTTRSSRTTRPTNRPTGSLASIYLPYSLGIDHGGEPWVELTLGREKLSAQCPTISVRMKKSDVKDTQRNRLLR